MAIFFLSNAAFAFFLFFRDFFRGFFLVGGEFCVSSTGICSGVPEEEEAEELGEF